MILSTYLRAAICALLVGLGFIGGWKFNGWRKDAQIFAMQQQTQTDRENALINMKQIEDEQRARLSIASELEVERAKKAKVIEKVITNDVIKYVQTPGAARCGIDANGVRIINHAAIGLPKDSDTAGQSDAGTTDVTAATVVANVTQNYAMCDETRRQLIALQDWARALN